MKDIIDDLASWGCDVNTAIDRFDGDRELYLECLSILIRIRILMTWDSCCRKEVC